MEDKRYRTIIKHIDKEDKEFDQRDLINKEDVMVAMTRDGYVKRSSIKSYMSSEECLPGVKPGDSCTDLPYIKSMDSKPSKE